MNHTSAKRRYLLRCSACGSRFEDDGVMTACTYTHAPALLRTVYDDAAFEPAPIKSLARYAKWMPVGRPLETTGRSPVYHAPRLGAKFGLANLWIAFSGWSPQRNASLPNGTYKDVEATAIIGRLDREEHRTLVVASAGNAAASLADAATKTGVRVVLVVPTGGWRRVATVPRIGKNVCTVMISDGSFDDAEKFAERLASTPSLVYEGGVRNVARRDAAGTVMFSAVEAIGRLPDLFVQATSSGVGVLGAYEASLRLIADGRWGTNVPRLLIGQNAPHAPIANAWQKSLARLPAEDANVARAHVGEVRAQMLVSQSPPYAVRGGLFDALVASGGNAYGIPNSEIAAAAKVFEEVEAVDIDPESAVAFCALASAVRAGDVKRNDAVLVHVTAGGRRARAGENNGLKPTHIISRTSSPDELREKLDAFLASSLTLTPRPWPAR